MGLAQSATRESEIQVRNVGADPSAKKTYNEYYCRLDHVTAAIAECPVGLVRTGTS
ncbi:hypothetical protein [Rhodococcus sp. T2V]|uniref:hypothetical protein n=1 Tax=Rhodococcus sp. T2V TaxID=3034164 RepID=UPI0023E11D55|nr:hypothetical protein [Rhodococcus sp. T2V]